MNSLRHSRPSTLTTLPLRPRATPLRSVTPVRHVHRERDFGIGYGNSSGYGNAERSYVAAAAPDYFRCR